MTQLVLDFFQLSGLDLVPPATFAELVPYLLCFFVALSLVLAVFRVLGSLLQLFSNGRWLR